MTPAPKDYTHRGWIGAVVLIAILLGVSFIPPQTIGGVKLRRANILSDILSFDDEAREIAEPELFDEKEFAIDMEQVAVDIAADTLPRNIQTTFEWVLPGYRAHRTAVQPDSLRLCDTLIPIEDFDTLRTTRFAAFCDTLLDAERPVRIAVLGDSFIEGDILTADLREKLQISYGGGGAGFAPMASPLTAFRRTISTQAHGWTPYNIMQRKSAPQAVRDNFYISGWVCKPAEGASTRWESTRARNRLGHCTTGRIFFISPRDSRVEAIVNDTLRQSFAVEGDASVRQLCVSAPLIRSLEFRVLSGAEEFLGYGAVFEADGVVVDNYSIRSNNGQAMFWTNPSVNAQINAMIGYDLVILQYGLNIMQRGVRGYGNYALQIEKMIAYVGQCFPQAAILVLGVSDRAVKTDTGVEPMDALPYMLSSQRGAAERSGTMFWNTCEAMRTQGGMPRFVANGWAGKDFTHINYAGGQRVAWALVDALNTAVTKRAAQRREELEVIRQAMPGITVDSARRVRFERLMMPDSQIVPIHKPVNQ